jgi:hypothetical protein
MNNVESRARGIPTMMIGFAKMFLSILENTGEGR